MLVIAAAAMPVLIGAAGLATDTIQWTLWKRQMQRQADSAAMAGAYALAQGKAVTPSAQADLARNAQVVLTATPLIEHAPSAGPYAGDARAVRVALEARHALAFSGLFLPSGPAIRAEATAAVLSNGNYCVLSLETGTEPGVTFQGSTTVDMGCGIATNSRGSNAISAGGSSSIRATPVAAVGGITESSNYQSHTTFLPYTIPQDDPYASLPTPSVSGCSPKVNVGPQGVQSLSPGCYKGMDIKGALTLQPGTYLIDGGTFDVGSQAQLSGTGVTIILTSATAASNPGSIATVNMNGGATVQLSAPTSGTYAGILFYQDRRATYQTNKFNGNSNSAYQGAIYMPAQNVEWTGTAGMVTDCLQIVSRRVYFSGNSSVNNSCPAGSGSHSFQGTRVRLVG